MMIKESRGPSIRMTTPDLNLAAKWKMEEAIRETTSRFHTKKVIGAVADGKLEFGCEKVWWLSSECDHQ